MDRGVISEADVRTGVMRPISGVQIGNLHKHKRPGGGFGYIVVL